jgi:hypothetical protein
MTEIPAKFEATAIIELMGHQRIAGHVTEIQMGGHSFLQVDVPETKSVPAFTRILSPSAIYAINPCTAEMAQMAAESIKSKPIMEFDMQRMISKMVENEVERRTALPAAEMEDDEMEDDEMEDDEMEDDAQYVPFGNRNF